MDCKTLSLPAPEGQYAVGRIDYYCVDTARREKYPHDDDHPYRELLLQVWYPADLTNKSVRLSYVTEAILDYTKGRGGRGLGYVDCSFMTNSYFHAPVSKAHDQYPVLIFSHGFSAPCYMYGSLLEELASQGYIVIAVNHTYAVDPVQMPDGRILGLGDHWHEILQKVSMDKLIAAGKEEVKTWIIDIEFVLDHLGKLHERDTKRILTGRLDLDKIGMFGHSFGGGTTVFINYLDKRCKAGVNMDGPIYGNVPKAPLKKPFMFLLSEEFAPDYDPTDEHLAESKITRIEFEKKNRFWKEGVQKAFNATDRDSFKILFKDGNHMAFSDYNLLQCTHTSCQLQYFQQLRFIRSFLVDFFNVYLKGNESKVLLDLTSTEELDVTAVLA